MLLQWALLALAAIGLLFLGATVALIAAMLMFFGHPRRRR